MRRIDLICKLVGPLFIALIDGISTKAAILTNLGMNVVSVGVEYFSIAKVGSLFHVGTQVLQLRYTIKYRNYRSRSRWIIMTTRLQEGYDLPGSGPNAAAWHKKH